MNRKNKIFKIIITIVIIICIICITRNTFAAFPERIVGTTSIQADATLNVAKIILGAFQTIGYILSTIILVWMGFKYITSAPDGKAEIKSHAVTYLIGIVFLFTAGSILGWIKASI